MKRSLEGARRLSLDAALFIVLAGWTGMVAAQETPAQPQTAAEMNRQAFELAKSAKSEEAVNQIIELCKQALETQPSAQEKQYANNLLSWSYNKRGECGPRRGKRQRPWPTSSNRSSWTATAGWPCTIGA